MPVVGHHHERRQEYLLLRGREAQGRTDNLSHIFLDHLQFRLETFCNKEDAMFLPMLSQVTGMWLHVHPPTENVGADLRDRASLLEIAARSAAPTFYYQGLQLL